MAAQQNALSKAQALDAAVKTGDKAQIQTAFADIGKNGCNGCHDAFREPQEAVDPQSAGVAMRGEDPFEARVKPAPAATLAGHFAAAPLSGGAIARP